MHAVLITHLQRQFRLPAGCHSKAKAQAIDTPGLSKVTTSTQTHAKTRGDAEAIAVAGATADVTDGVTQADATTGASVSVGSTVN